MATFLFDEIIFGPVKSRRLGVSLGVNLLPTDSKFCNFNCIYCECGWTPEKGEVKANFHPVELIESKLDAFLLDYKTRGKHIDTITFAGNGEPTLHPNFEEVIDKTIVLRDKYFPEAKVSVLSNATMLRSRKVVKALKKVDNRILKLDSAINETALLIDQPLGKYHIDKVIELLEQFEGDYILQTMMLKGVYKGQTFDNTSPKELEAYYALLEKIRPAKVMLYSIARDTPADNLEKINAEQLNEIAQKIEAMGICTEVSA